MIAARALARAHLLALLRDRPSLSFSFLFPAVVMLGFGLLLGGRKVPGGGHYIDYIVPGVMCWGVANGALFGVAFTVMGWRRDGVLRLVRTTPAPLPAILGSAGLAAVVTGLAQAALFLLVGLLPFLGLRVSAGGVPLILPVLFAGIAAFFALGLIVGMSARSLEAVAPIGNSIMVPMAFLAGSFFPLPTAPSWLKTVSLVLPLRYMDDGAGGALRGGGAAALAVPCLALLAFTALFSVAAARTSRWRGEG